MCAARARTVTESMAVTDSTIARRLADSVCAAAADTAIDASTRHAVERVLLDSLGCGLGAVDSIPAQAARRWARLISGENAAAILGTRERSSVLGAALANATMIRHLDMNDCDWAHDPAHPSDNIGACLAVGEAQNASSMDVIKAILVAYEIQMRSTEFTKVPFFRKTGWDHTTFVALASAAAAGVLLRLDPGRLAHALVIAVSYPALGELRVGAISNLKAVSAGLAAGRGVEAAHLASYGVTGPEQAFEGKRGLSRLALGECDWDILTAPVTAWRLPRTCIKQYPAAYIIHSAIDAALALRREAGLAPEAIREVTVAGFGWLVEDMVHGMGGKSRYEIDTRETADHSLPYCVAVSLVDGEYTLAQLAQARWRAPEVQAMLRRTRCVHDPALDGGFPGNRPARVTVATHDGRTFSRQVAFPKGDPRNPLSDEEIAAKFRQLARGVLTPAEQEHAIRIALEFSRHSVRDLVTACTPAR